MAQKLDAPLSGFVLRAPDGLKGTCRAGYCLRHLAGSENVSCQLDDLDVGCLGCLPQCLEGAIGTDVVSLGQDANRPGFPVPVSRQRSPGLRPGPHGWRNSALTAALTPAEAASPLMSVPYSLRHAAVSTWLRAIGDPAQVAEWAGHSVLVLLRVYAKCVRGTQTDSLQKILDMTEP